VKIELHRDFNIFMYGPFTEVVDTTIHPADCTCMQCKPRPEKIRQPYDSLYLKQKYSQEL
jgi:hypothetical protein